MSIFIDESYRIITWSQLEIVKEHLRQLVVWLNCHRPKKHQKTLDLSV